MFLPAPVYIFTFLLTAREGSANTSQQYENTPEAVMYLTRKKKAHRCAGGLKKKFDLPSGTQRYRHFVRSFNVPVQAATRDEIFYTMIPTHRPNYK